MVIKYNDHIIKKIQGLKKELEDKVLNSDIQSIEVLEVSQKIDKLIYRD